MMRPAACQPVTLRIEIGEPAQGAQAGHEAVLAAAVDHERRQPLHAAGGSAAAER